MKLFAVLFIATALKFAVDPMPECYPCDPPPDDVCNIMPNCCPQGCPD